MTTIRSLMLAQQARHEGWTHPATKRTACPRCDESWPCADRVAADAVLAELDEAERPGTWIDANPIRNETYRLVSDPGVS